MTHGGHPLRSVVRLFLLFPPTRRITQIAMSFQAVYCQELILRDLMRCPLAGTATAFKSIVVTRRSDAVRLSSVLDYSAKRACLS